MKSNADLTHLEHEKESLSAEISSRRQELDQSKKLLDHQRAEEAKLRRVITEASAERARQKKELEQVCNPLSTKQLLSFLLTTIPSCIPYNPILYETKESVSINEVSLFHGKEKRVLVS